MNPIALDQKIDIPSLQLSFDYNGKDFFSERSYVELISEQHKLDLPYILGVFYTKKIPYFCDALNLCKWTKTNTPSIADKKMRTVFYFAITKVEDQNIEWNYLGHSREIDYRKDFIDTFFNAAQNDTQAMYDIGDYFSHGFGVNEDSKEAVKWWTLSADRGNINAQYHLGLCYLCGYDVNVDPEKAEKYLQLVFQKALIQKPVQMKKESKFIESVEERDNDKDHGKIDSKQLINALKKIQNANYKKKL